MKGVIVNGLEEMVVKRFGKEKWSQILDKLGTDRRFFLATSDIDDAEVMKIFSATSEVLDRDTGRVMRDFSRYWISTYAKRIYPAYFMGVNDAKSLILKVDEIHRLITQNMENARPPHFEYEWKDSRTLIVHYHSRRSLIDLAVELIRAVGEEYGEPLEIKKLGNSAIEVRFSH